MTTIINHYGLENDIKTDNKAIKTIVVNLKWHNKSSKVINKRIVNMPISKMKKIINNIKNKEQV